MQRICTSEANWRAIGLLAYRHLLHGHRVFSDVCGVKRLRETKHPLNLQPVVAAIAAIAQDTFTWDKPIAGALVIAGAYVVTQGSSKRCESS